MFKRVVLALVLALFGVSQTMAQEEKKLVLDLQLLNINTNKNTVDDLMSGLVSNESLTVKSMPDSKYRATGIYRRLEFTPRLAFDYGTSERGWTVVGWGFRQNISLTSTVSPALYNRSERTEGASIDVSYRLRVVRGLNVYMGAKSMYGRVESSSQSGDMSSLFVKETTETRVGGLGGVVGLSYSKTVSDKFGLAASVSESLVLAKSLAEINSHETSRTGFVSVTEASARLSYKLSDHSNIGIGWFSSSWKDVSARELVNSHSGITFAGGMASVGFSF